MSSSTTSTQQTSMVKELTSDDSDARKFNQNLIQLFEQFGKLYPEDRDVQMYRDKIVIATRANAKLPSVLFLSFCGNHIKQIMTLDEHFFMTYDYKKGLDIKDAKDLKLIEKILTMWREAESQTLKDTVGKYMQILLVYAIKCCKRHDLAVELNKYRQTPLKM